MYDEDSSTYDPSSQIGEADEYTEESEMPLQDFNFEDEMLASTGQQVRAVYTMLR